MIIEKSALQCLNCEKPEHETPLLHLHYSGEDLWICPQCLPTLIHAPQKMASKIKNTDQIKPADHQH